MTMVQVEPMTSATTTQIHPPHHRGRKSAPYTSKTTPSTTTTVPTKMKILSVLPSSDSREESTTTEAVLRQSRDEDEHDFVLVSTSIDGGSPPALHSPNSHRLDRYGFIANMDRHGNLLEHNDPDDGLVLPVPPTFAQAKTTERRVAKWNDMMENLPPANLCLRGGRRRKLVLRRLRKGVPETQRARVWQWLAAVPAQIRANPGVYQKLVQQASESRPPTPPDNASHFKQPQQHSKSFKVIQDTIERDIHRTFPRHSMFFQDESLSSGKANPENGQSAMVRTSTAQVASHMGCLAESTREIAAMIMELDGGSPPALLAEPKSRPVHPDYVPPQHVLEAQGGQASLRRVLKAYSVYDREVGYCQGMNFIAGMFLTLVSEEEAFWMLVAVMKDKPCRMRGLFGEGMQETHKVLHVAEKLIHQYLPRLGKHMDAEHIHVTMYATQWLLTQYTSSFQFDLVLRVWDCVLAEGWKMTYRVMLALLKKYESTLLQLSFEDILNFFRELPDNVNGNEIIQTAVRIPLRRRQIAKYEKDWEKRGTGSRS